MFDPQRTVAHRSHRMPIVTPSYPQQNTACTVSDSMLKVMQDDFRSSLVICEEIISSKDTWDKLFETPNFFAKYQHFLVLEASSDTEEKQLEWHGFVESMMHHLIRSLASDSIELAHIWSKPYPPPGEGHEKLCLYWFVGLDIKTQAASALNPPQHLELSTPIKKFCDLVMRAANRRRIWKTGMKMEATYKEMKELEQYLPPGEWLKLKTEQTLSLTSSSEQARDLLNYTGNSNKCTH